MRSAYKTVWNFKDHIEFFMTVVQFTQVLFRVAHPFLKKEILKKSDLWRNERFLLRKKGGQACISKGREGRLKRRKKSMLQRNDSGRIAE